MKVDVFVFNTIVLIGSTPCAARVVALDSCGGNWKCEGRRTRIQAVDRFDRATGRWILGCAQDDKCRRSLQ